MTQQTPAQGDYFWRGGRKIALEKVEDRFTAVLSSTRQLEQLQTTADPDDIAPVTRQIYKVQTSITRRDGEMARLRAQIDGPVIHHAYRPAGSDGTIYYITDTIIVTFKQPTDQADIEAILHKYALRVYKTYHFRRNSFLVQVTDSSGANPIKVANALAAEPTVRSAEPNLVNRFEAFQPAAIPTDPFFVHQWHLQARNEPDIHADASINAVGAWSITAGSRDIVVAIIDDGFDLTHPDFSGPDKVVHPKDYVDGDAHPFPDSFLSDFHGTPTAGVALAERNGIGVVGIAHGCALMPVRFPLAADDDFLLSMFTEVGAKADVISCSWGPPPVYAPLPSALIDLFSQLADKGGPRGKGCVICFAAGNYNAPLQDQSNPDGFIWLDRANGIHRATFGPIENGFCTHPAVIAVAASTSLNTHAAYSNWGLSIALCAPSNNFHPLNPSSFVPGRGIWTTDNLAFGLGFQPGSQYTSSFGGTSSATPLVAGVAALMLSANPDLSARKVREVLEKTADKIVDPAPDLVTGVNRSVYDEAGRCDWFGHGKVNAAAAVAEAACYAS